MKNRTTIIRKLIGFISLISLMLGLWPMAADAQIRIGGNVYGGGNHAEVRGSTRVTVKAGDIGAVLDPDAERPLKDPQGRVFGGARMANVGGNSFVHIDGEHATDYILINEVFGGNDIAGNIGTTDTIPSALTEVGSAEKKNNVDNTFNSFVRISTKVKDGEGNIAHYTEEEIKDAATDPENAAYGKRTTDIKPPTDAKSIYIGQLFAGGNGDYYYRQSEPDDKDSIYHYIYNWWNTATPIATVRSKVGDVGFQLPELDKTYLEIKGGSIVYGYGGGNNVTVKEENIIHYDNPSAVVNHILVDKDGKEGNAATYEAYKDYLAKKGAKPDGYDDLLTTARFKEMGINTTFSQPSSGAYQVGRFFGGNNKAEMTIRPTWNLLAGKIRNLYSGGNKGNMTSPEGLLLEIKDYSSLIVDNLYGGCRMADVRPTVDGEYTPCTNLPGYKFPNELSARTLVRGGYVHNVYGGNDVTGTVYGGNAVGIYTAVYGNVYGGGNGAYPYTDLISEDNETYGDTYGDFYYNVTGSSVEALNAFRPNAEQVSIRLKGTDAMHQTIIHGSVFVGGNCASLSVKKKNPLIELKMGSHVIVDNVYLGNNGEGMIDTTYLKIYDDDNFSTLDLTNSKTFAGYMEGVAMTLKPDIVFDSEANGDPENYTEYSSYVGSFFCGGNVGSMAVPGKMSLKVDKGLNIYSKFVGGCNNADVEATNYNAYYEGGVIGTENERGNEEDEYYTDDGTEKGNIKDRLEIDFHNLTVMPLRWNDKFENVYTANGNVATKLTKGKEYYHTELRSTKFLADGTETADADHTYYELKNIGTYLEWNTAKWDTDEDNFIRVENNAVDKDTRLLEGNVYGGCYNSGHVNGNIILNINDDVLKKDDIFGTGKSELFGHEKSKVEFLNQRDDVMAIALSVFGAGHGENTEVWGSATSNLNKGYTLQIFGGGEQGVVGKRKHYDSGAPIIDGGKYTYDFDPRYSTIVNLKGSETIYSKEGTSDNLAEAEYLYGGGNEGLIAGNTLVNLGNGRIYDAFGGSSDADIYGHSEVYIGRQPNGSGGYESGFPWINDIVYGGNDFGGTISGEYEDGYDFTARLRNYETDKTQIHGYKDGEIPEVLKSSSYVEYLQGRVDSIFGGSYGYYDYKNTKLYGTDAAMPKQESAFVSMRPVANDHNALKAIFGAGTGYPGNRDADKAQDHSYVLIDIPDGMDNFTEMEVYGSGSYNGLGMREDMSTTFAPGYDLNKFSAIIDLLHGEIGNAYGGSYNEGNTSRTVVNVPAESTIKIKNIFGGAYGTRILPPCDVIQSNVNYKNTSENALVTGAIYGGNNNQRRTIFTNVNISSPVWSNKEKGYLATVYGAGKGFNSWSEHTHVEMLDGAKVYEVYGGGEMGHVLNAETVQKYMQNEKDKPSVNVAEEEPWNNPARWTDKVGGTLNPSYKTEWDKAWKDAWSLGDYYTPNEDYNDYFETFVALRGTSLVRKAEIDERDYTGYTDEEKAKRQYIYNTNVIINEGAEVVNYAYGGGYGSSGSLFSGDVWGHTYIALLGGTVKKDIYAAGTAGAVDDAFAQTGAYNATTNPYGFTASTTAYIKGGTCRNVYGGGWEGNVGLHTGAISDSPAGDKPGETYVVVGDLDGSSFTEGIPAIQRNVYGGGEGGAVYGTANVKLNNGYIGYEYKDEKYVEKTEDDTKETPNKLLEDAGCLFGGGYVDNSTVDKTNVTIYGGNVRNSVFGGGEIAAIGRGDMKEKPGGTDYELKGIYRPGKTNVKMYGGHVQRNVFGGGRGYDNLSRHGTLHADGYVFGQTEVSIHGGEIGTVSGVADGDGNVFGGGDAGLVYSAYEITPTTFGKGVKEGVRYDGLYQGYYYKHDWEDDGDFVTEEVPTSYYTAEEASTYNTEHSLSEGDEGYKKAGDVKTTETERLFTEDCKVLVEPMCKVKEALSIDGKSYTTGQYVPIGSLNKLQNKNTDEEQWNRLDQTGIIIHNAVFAGGNAKAGSLTTGANTNTVFGNATASINDVYHRDLITLGTRHTGGLYGDGNLTLVDGYRELNITNYGTDYYSIAKEITIDQYRNLPEREAAYYELNYTCMKTCQDKNGDTYTPQNPSDPSSKAATITADDMLDLFLVKKGDVYVSIRNDASGKYIKETEEGGTPVLKWNESQKAWEPNSTAGYWVESGVLPVYAGRLMNSIQRADLCGVFGSRMVMQGAQDRVPEEADYTNYTINRVREVSLNKKESVIQSDLAISESSDEYYKKHTHGNYFGIYNVVNYLGALTSDVHFTDVRKTDNTSNDELYKRTLDEGGAYGTATYYDWKKENITNKTRNNGASYNKVALASGVYLEITTEESTGDDLYEKVWGPITGVVELDLINVSTGIGGGFVYAKNVHGEPSVTGHKNTTLTALNDDAVTQWDYTYTDEVPGEGDSKTNTQHEWETSGNFVHSTQTIIDDCYNISNRYLIDKSPMPAHYWYIKGSTYVYDQYISAYTGQSNAFSEVVEIPLTIAAASHGKMKLLNVMPNRYAYYSSPGETLGDGKKMIINGKTYYKNDPISYWDWYLLSNYEKELFVPKTYVNCITCNIDGTEYAAGTYIMTEGEFTTYKSSFPEGKTKHEYTNAAGETIKDADDNEADDNYIFRESNNVGHDKGYILTYEVNNPSQWDNWYTLKNGDYKAKITLAEYNKETTVKSNYEDGPTYRLKDEITVGAVLGQSEYKLGDLIPEATYTTYEGIKSHVTEAANGKQASFEKAYIVKDKITETTVDGHEIYYNPGTAVSATFRGTHSSDCEEAYICTKSIQLTKENVIYKDSKMKKSEAEGYVTDVKSKMGNTYKEMTLDEIKALTVSESLTAEKKKELISLATLRDDLQTYLVQAYYCTSEPAVDEEDNPIHYYYGGNYYESGHNYRGLEAWSSMSETDRKKFDYNYDALDLLIDKDYSGTEGKKYQYDGKDFDEETDVRYKDDQGNWHYGNKATYSLETSVDYTAEYNGNEDSDPLTNTVTVTRNGVSKPTNVLKKGDELSREEFEDKLINEKRHYAPVAVKNATEEIVNEVSTGKYLVYVVKTPFQIGSTPYAVGETISSATYKSLSESEQKNITTFKFSSADKTSEAVYYYCRESYTQGTTVTPISSETIPGAGGGVSGGEVQLGTLISSTNYGQMKNEQLNFIIHGVSPTETSTLYVSRESNIYDLSKEKIITVIYEYDYDETDTQNNVTPISERHVLNIHITFKSGVPIVEDITPPEIILPGDYVTLGEPTIKPGAYEVTGGGWELFATKRDAESHTNGVEYKPTFDPLYWYQDQYYVAYYAKSYLGRTYSNAVPVSVANYHDMKKVMDAAEHHYYIDHKNVQRDSKIYINDYSGSSQNGLDMFKNLYDLTLVTESSSAGTDGYTVADGKITAAVAPGNTNLVDHALLDERVKGGDHLEFFLRTDIDHSSSSWTTIGTDAQCFKGTLHGDGHTISGLDNSLFNNLCGDVYNLGVSGSFNSAGVADKGTGYIESAWVKTSATTPLGTKPNAVFGAPSDTKGYQLVNSYFWNGNKNLFGNIDGDDPDVLDYNETITSGGARGKATAKSDTAFYNGELAYDLNNFYLYKRYANNKNSINENIKHARYYTIGSDNKLTLQPYREYVNNPELCSSGYIYTPEGKTKPDTVRYVEERFADGDFRYAGGIIPDEKDERMYEDPKDKTKVSFHAIWPDDYIFFGQKLTYGWAAQAHQNVPTAVAREDGRLSTSSDANRVYRAPAYYRSKVMDVAYFNPHAYLAQQEKLTDKQIEDNEKAVEEGRLGDVVTPRDAYPNMTAIDFAGHNGANGINGTYGVGLIAAHDGIPALFYPPLLDDDGLIGILNCDETQNIVVYAPAESSESGYANAKTYGVLNTYFTEPAYSDHYDEDDTYRRVTKATAASVHGHLVQSNKKTTTDHLLVDYQDFNAPITYTLGEENRMWYQRLPQDREYVDLTKGWQGISIPFTAELVTTDTKGEITHFYNDGGKNAKGHEYWLRQLTENGTMEEVRTNVLKADFVKPAASGSDKTVENTFLWDYYYKNEPVHNQKDKNADKYEQDRKYYENPRTHSGYPLLAKATPYIIGFPGNTYYEFDLSGNFEAKNTAAAIPKLGKQVITFASDKAAVIGVSDDEMTGTTVKYSSTNYTFKPNYMNRTLTHYDFVMNSDGDAYVQLNDASTGKYHTTGTTYATSAAFNEAKEAAIGKTLYTDADGTLPAGDYADASTVYYSRVSNDPITKNEKNKVTASHSAFRPYFTISGAGSSPARGMQRAYAKMIVFGGADDDMREGPETVLDGSLEIFTRGYNIVTRSHMNEAVAIRIVTAAGATFKDYVLQPGETIETTVPNTGVYVVNKKKVFVE